MIAELLDTRIPHLSTAQMVEVDRAMTEDFGIDLARMMESAGRNLAHLARSRFLAGDPAGRSVAVLAGSGGNGGGAMVAARRLHNWGAEVSVLLGAAPGKITRVPGRQLNILRRMKVPVNDDEDAWAGLDRADLIIDGLIGYSLKGAPRGAIAKLIGRANRSPSPILALDVPSGLDADSGRAFDPAIKAMATMTLALPKLGLATEAAGAWIGELYLADIGVPPELYRRPPIGLSVGALFARDEILRIN